MKHRWADALFAKASDYQKEHFLANKKLFEDPAQTSCQMLPVEDLRKMVQPIGAQ